MKDKIIELFKNKQKLPADNTVKFFAGYNYIKLDRDENGNNFNAQHLTNYAENSTYLITVMREHNDKTALYNYEVPYEKLMDFILKFHNNVLDGKIIEIDKHPPENFA